MDRDHSSRSDSDRDRAGHPDHRLVQRHSGFRGPHDERRVRLHLVDFGFVPPRVSVGDFVWVDTNRDGIQQAGEPGLAGVTVTLTGPTGLPVTDVNGAAVGPILTPASGAYLFTNLPTLAAGQHYTVSVSNPAGYEPTLTGQGTTATDSSSGSADSVALTSDTSSVLTLDFGFVKPAVSVGDFVFLDSDRDGVQDAGEPGIPGVTLRLIGPGGGAVTDVNGAVVGPVVTDAAGKYLFPLLPVLTAGQNIPLSSIRPRPRWRVPPDDHRRRYHRHRQFQCHSDVR